MATPDVSIDAPGLIVAERTIRGLAEEFGPRNAVRAFAQPIRAALRPAEAAIKQNTPVDDGELAQSVRIRTGVPTRAIRRSKFFLRNNDTIFVGRVGWTWNNSAGSQWAKALAIEFGTIYLPPRRIIRNALEQNRNQIVSDFSAAIGPAVIRTAQRLAKRAQAGTLRIR